MKYMYYIMCFFSIHWSKRVKREDYCISMQQWHFYDYMKHKICIEDCPSIAPFLKNNGPRPHKGPRFIIFKEWIDTRTSASLKSTHQLQPLPQFMECINLLPFIINYSVHVSIHITYITLSLVVNIFYISELNLPPSAPK